MATRILQDQTNKNADLLTDDRFGKLWEDADYRVDEEDEHYKLYHSSTKKISDKDIAQHFESVEDETEKDFEENEEESDENETPIKKNGELKNQKREWWGTKNKEINWIL